MEFRQRAPRERLDQDGPLSEERPLPKVPCVSAFRSLPGASAVREDIFSGSRGTGRPGGGGQGCRGPLFPSPPAGLRTRAQKLGAVDTRVRAAGEGGRKGEGKGRRGS